MNQPAILLVCAVLAVTSSITTCFNPRALRYLDFSIEWGPTNVEQTKATLLAMDVHQGDTPETVLSKLQALLNNSPPNSFHYSICSDLISLAKSTETRSQLVTMRALEICEALTDPSFQHKDEFFAFLRRYGKRRFTNLMPPANTRLMSGSNKNMRALHDFDKFYAACLGQETYSDDVVLPMLRQLDIATSDFDVTEGLEVVLAVEEWGRDEIEDPVWILDEFIKQRCLNLRKCREYHINVVSLAATLGVSPEYFSTDSNKLKEYNRLCASLFRERFTVNGNLARQIRCQNIFDVKYLDWYLLGENWEAGIRDTRKALRGIYVDPEANEGSIFDEILRMLAPRSRALTKRQYTVYNDIVQLNSFSESYKKTVMSRMTNTVMEICAILTDPTFQPQKKLARLLLELGNRKYALMIPNVLFKLELGTARNNEAILKLDQLFAAFFGWDECHPDIILKMLIETNWQTSELNVNKVIDVILSSGQKEVSDVKRPIHVVASVLLKNCDNLRRHREFEINVLTLAATFGVPTEHLPIQVNKLKEYNRLCGSLRREQDSVMASFEKQINWENWPNRAVLDLDKLFAAFSNLQAYDDKVMLQSLKQLQLMTSKIDVNAAAEVAVNMETWNGAERKRPLAIVFGLISRKCDELQSGREFHMHTHNLAGTYYFPSEGLQTEVNKWREYNRLCEDLRREQNSVMANLGQQINWDAWPNQAVVDLDQLIAAFLNLQAYDDNFMLQIVRRLDLATNNFNVNAAAEAALNLGTWNEEERNNPIRLICAFISRKCSELQSGREFHMHTIAMTSSTFQFPSESIETEVNKWKEYNNFCALLQGRESAIINNLSRQVNMQYWLRPPPDEPITRDFLSKIN